jgi:hypothetical protein
MERKVSRCVICSAISKGIKKNGTMGRTQESPSACLFGDPYHLIRRLKRGRPSRVRLCGLGVSP